MFGIKNLFRPKEILDTQPKEAENKDSIQIALTKCTFSGGQSLELNASDIIVIVGPNNSGKSAALNNIIELLRYLENETEVITHLAFSKRGSEAEFNKWVATHCFKKDLQINHFGETAVAYHLQEDWEKADRKGLNDLANIFCAHVTVKKRLSAAANLELPDTLKEGDSHPAHRLYRSSIVTKKLSELFFKAFDEYLIVNPRGGSRLRIHIGSHSDIQPFEPYDDWVQKISALPLLDQQGDGMKSFFSVLLYTMVLESKIFLLDEPEAFLHPPQARLLGEFLPELVPPSRQLFMATHSGDIIKGLLNTKSNRVRVVSLRRPTKFKNNATFLNNEDLSNVWSDPLLRSSNLIEGLFHERVILCESDGDCRFYQAIAIATESKLSVRTSDILFTHCNGKSKLHVAVRALRKLGVPLRVVVDFDILQDGNELQRLYEEAGGNWSEIADFHKKVHHAIEALRGGVKIIDARKQINAEFDAANGQSSILTDSQIERIRAILNNCSPWRLAKSTGRHLLENGDPSRSFDLLNEKLKSKDIFIIEEGELESFAKTLPKGRKSSWLENVLDLDLSLSPELERARNFVARLCS